MLEENRAKNLGREGGREGGRDDGEMLDRHLFIPPPPHRAR